MRPFLALRKEERTKIGEAVKSYSRSEETRMAVVSLLEEIELDFGTAKEAISKLENEGMLKPGLWKRIESFFHGEVEGNIDHTLRQTEGYV